MSICKSILHYKKKKKKICREYKLDCDILTDCLTDFDKGAPDFSYKFNLFFDCTSASDAVVQRRESCTTGTSETRQKPGRQTFTLALGFR